MRFESLNIFRFIAALIVITFHFGRNCSIIHFAPNFLTSGPEMVTFFFVLSGYVLIFAYYGKNYFSISGYLLNRASKIVPLYMIGLMLVMISNNRYKVDYSLILSLTFLQSWIPPHALDLNVPAWSVSVEAFFYALFPLILFLLKQKERDPYYVLVFSLLFWIITQVILSILLNSELYKSHPSLLHHFIYYFPISHFCSFGLGIAGGYLVVKKQNILELPKIFAYILLVLTCTSIFLIFEYKDLLNRLGLSLPFGSSFFAPLFFLFIFALIIGSNTYFAKFLSNRMFMALGKSSYALFILQLPMYKLFNKFISPALSFDKSSSFYIFLFADIILSIIFFYLIEKPGRKIMEKLAAKLDNTL